MGAPAGAHLIWAQRHNTVYLTWEYLNAKDVTVDIGEKSLSFSATVGDKQVATQGMPLFAKIVPAESKWFKNDRCVQAVLRKAEEEWWDTLASDRSFKPFVKADWSRWLEEDDAGYDGKPEGWDAQAGAAWEDEFDSDDEDVPLDDLDISDLPDPAAPASD